MNGYCNIFIYKNCKILKNKNFKVDNIDDYLAGLDTLNEINATTELPEAIQGQLMKHSLKLKYNIVIPINNQLNFANMGLGQHYLTFLDEYNYNYLTAQNYDQYKTGPTTPWRTRVSSKVYYFIVGKKWLSENSIELELEMDVINTLLDNGGGGYYKLELSDKTTILREHKDRIRAVGALNLYLPIIDRYSENIFVPLHKTAESGLVQKTNLPAPFNVVNLNFFLIYKSRENPETNPESPVDILLCADDVVYVKGGSTGYTGARNPKAELGNAYGWYVYGGDSGNIGSKISFTARDGQHTLTLTQNNQCFYISNSLIAVLGVNATLPSTIISSYRPKALTQFKNVLFENVGYVRKGTNGVDITLTTITNVAQDTSFPTVSTQNIRIGTIYDIDRTDPKLLKILKLPYCPIEASNWTIVAETEDGPDYFGFLLPAGWGIYSGTPTLLKYQTSNIVDCFKNENIPVVNENNELYSPFEVLKEMTINPLLVGGTILKTILNLEPKLYHSDYYIRKFVYDSFAYTFKMENYNHPSGHGEYVFLTFMVSSTMNSKMAFIFSQCDFIGSNDANNRGLKFDDQDYSNLVYVARNNELPLFNSAYLQYIRTGFNYDVKTKNRQLASNIVGGVLSTTGAIVSAVAGGPVGVAGAVALGIGAVSKFTSAIVQNAQSEQNIEQKLKSTEMQGLSVIGSDDVDIMSEYTENNKAKDITYEASPKIKKCLFDLFYYCGYIANYQGVPNTTSRMWFNFVQADPVYNYEQNFPQEFVEELTKKFKEGITYLHKHSDRWDFEQQYENWETSLLPSNS